MRRPLPTRSVLEMIRASANSSRKTCTRTASARAPGTATEMCLNDGAQTSGTDQFIWIGMGTSAERCFVLHNVGGDRLHRQQCRLDKGRYAGGHSQNKWNWRKDWCSSPRSQGELDV